MDRIGGRKALKKATDDGSRWIRPGRRLGSPPSRSIRHKWRGNVRERNLSMLHQLFPGTRNSQAVEVGAVEGKEL